MKKTTHLNRFLATIMIAAGLWVGFFENCSANTMITASYGAKAWLSTTGGSSWVETTPAGAGNKNWGCTGADGDGSVLLAGINGGRLYLSTNSGSSWSEVQPAGASDVNWKRCVTDFDGQYILVTAESGRVYTSHNGGSSWTERQPKDGLTHDWNLASISRDGQYMVTAYWGGRLYVSADYGATWNEKKPAGDVNANWMGSAFSADGSVIMVGAQSGRLWLSTDYGANWSEKRPAGDSNLSWYALASDVDGSVLLAGAYNGRLWLSTDGGANWSEKRPYGDYSVYWYYASMNDDGSVMAATFDSNGYIYGSSNSGSTWSKLDVGVSGNWRGISTPYSYVPYEAPTISITFPVASETQYWAHWTLNYDLGDATSTWDMVRAYVCYGTESGDADACAYTDHSGVDTKYVYNCDNATTTMAATSTIDIPVQNNLAADTYHYKAYIEASNANAGGLCAPQYWGTPLIESTQYQATLTKDLTDITNYVSPDDYWTTDWGGLWGTATSSIVYSAGSSIFDTVTEPLLEQLANFSNWFDTNTATNAGVEAGSSIGILISKAKDFINVIPGLQLFYILLIAVVVEFGIFLVRFLFKLAQLIRG